MKTDGKDFPTPSLESFSGFLSSSRLCIALRVEALMETFLGTRMMLSIPRKSLPLSSRMAAIGLALLPCIAYAQEPIIQSSKMAMGTYAALGPIRDTAEPGLAFPAIDLFSPAGELIYHAYSVDDLLKHLQDPLHTERAFQTDTIKDIAARYPNINLQPEKLLGRYTVLFISASQCHACEMQEEPLQRAELSKRGINQVLLMLGLQ